MTEILVLGTFHFLESSMDVFSEAAQADLCAPSNPRPAAAEDLKSLLRELA